MRSLTTRGPATAAAGHSYPMRTTWTVGCALALVMGCGGGAGETDGGLDAGRADAGGEVDAGPEHDAGGAPDAGETDAGGEPDGGARDAGSDASAPDPDAGPPGDGGPPGSCHERLGAPCEESSECGAGFECEIGRCRPQGRELCGGFAGAPCTIPPYLSCLYYESADFGPCFTSAERDCLCARYPSAFQCGSP